MGLTVDPTEAFLNFSGILWGCSDLEDTRPVIIWPSGHRR